MVSVGFESITVSTSVVGLTAANLTRDQKPAPTAAVIQVLTNSINLTTDGTTVTNAVGGGTQRDAAAEFVVTTMSDLKKLRMIRIAAASADATVNVTYLS